MRRRHWRRASAHLPAFLRKYYFVFSIQRLSPLTHDCDPLESMVRTRSACPYMAVFLIVPTYLNGRAKPTASWAARGFPSSARLFSRASRIDDCKLVSPHWKFSRTIESLLNLLVKFQTDSVLTAGSPSSSISTGE